jgi:hypothetical protein
MSTKPTEPEVIIENERKDFYEPDDTSDGPITEGQLTVINAAEVNQQIATARRWPRSPKSFRRRAFEMATYDQDGALECIYGVPRDGKIISGPSIRFAEILQISWGNCRSGTEVTDIGDEFVTAEGTFIDLETNMATKAKILRRIVGKTGKRFSVDMIATTGNAACSLALRNAILRGVPKALWKDVFDETQRVAAGTQQTFVTRRDKAFKELAVQGATPEMVFALFKVQGIEDIRTEHLLHLRGLHNAIRDNETTLEEAFAIPEGAKPGEVVPPRPKQSEFDRKQGGKPDDANRAETQAKTDEQPAKPAETAAPPQETESSVEGEDAAVEQSEWFEKQKATLAGLKRVRDVAELREAVADGLFAEQEREWVTLCDAQTKAIVHATATAKAKK